MFYPLTIPALRKMTVIVCAILMASASLSGADSHVSTELVPLEYAQSDGGYRMQLAMVFQMDADWHIYWKNAGEAGMPTMFYWDLPGGYQLVKQEEPVPRRLEEDGIVTFIHGREAIYLFEFQVNRALAPDDTLTVDVEWLECKDICQAGQSRHTLAVTEAAFTPDLSTRSVHQRALERLALPGNELVNKIVLEQHALKVNLARQRLTGAPVAIQFFPEDEFIYHISETPRLKAGLFKTVLHLKLDEDRSEDPDAFRGILILENSGGDRHAFNVNTPIIRR